VDGLIFFTSAHGGPAPLYAVRTSARGTMNSDSASATSSLAWSVTKNGAYMQTPVVYRGRVYSCSDRGVLRCFDAKTGKQEFAERLGKRNCGFSASPVAGDGKVYFTSEEGDVYVLAEGPKYKQIAVNALGEICMA